LRIEECKGFLDRIEDVDAIAERNQTPAKIIDDGVGGGAGRRRPYHAHYF
jgi:hypothetical protein